MSAPTFLGMAHDLMHDVDAKAAFEQDPEGFLAARGFDGLSPDDLTDAVGFVAETLPPETAIALAGSAGVGGELALTHLAGAEAEEMDLVTSPDDIGSGLGDHTSGASLPEPDGLDAEGEEDEDEDGRGGDTAFGHGHQAVDVEQLLGPDDEGFRPVEQGADEAGIGVTWAQEDADDVSPADPAFSQLFQDALDVDVDPTIAADLTSGDASDPIGEALTWAYDGADGAVPTLPDDPDEPAAVHGFEAEDVDDASPPEHGDIPDHF